MRYKVHTLTTLATPIDSSPFKKKNVTRQRSYSPSFTVGESVIKRNYYENRISTYNLR